MNARWLLALTVLGGCWSSGTTAATPPPANASPAAPIAGVIPSIEIISVAEWEACTDCDDQSNEGGAPLRFKHFPAITQSGDLIAVTEERDGWGHVPIPGVRLLDRDGKSVTWLPLAGDRDGAKAAVRDANAELAKYAWIELEKPTPKVRELSDTVAETELTFGRYTALYQRRDDGNTRLPPSLIRVTDNTGRMVRERRDTEQVWNAPPRCNMPAFELVGVSATGGVMLFMTGLGMGGHNCDGVEQRPSWHVLAFR